MSVLRRLLLAAAAAALPAAALPAAPALAADLMAAPYIGGAPEVVPVEIGSGWYIRGDVGYAAKTHSPNFSYRTYDSGTDTYSSTPYDPSSSVDANFSYGAGIGYHFNQFFRMDATIERTNGKFGGTSSSTAPCSFTGETGTGCDTQDSASFAGWSALVNAYVEPGTFMGFTPYVGAGAGMTRMNWGDLTSAQYCTDGGNACGAPGYVGTVSHGGQGDWRFTWAVMAGLAYDLTPHLQLDVGYRYRHIAGGAMYGWDSNSALAGATGVQASDKGLSTHEVRVGLRYSIW